MFFFDAVRVRARRFTLAIRSFLIRGKSIFIPIDKVMSCRFLNVGCGKNFLPGFINLDYVSWTGVDICWDITKKFPLSDASLDGIFSEHCLEHIEYHECIKVLSEFYRLLRPGGCVRLIVPDAGLYLNLYFRACHGDIVEFPYVGDVGRKDYEEDSKIAFTPMMAVNRIFRSYGHKFGYDYETLRSMLCNAGFRDVEKVSYRNGRVQELLVDSLYRSPQSLYVEGFK